MSEKRASGEGDESGHARHKRQGVEDQRAGAATRAPRPASCSPEPTLTDCSSVLPLPRHYVRHPARREPGTVRGWRTGEMAELIRYVKWAGRTRGGRERCGTHPFRDLVHRARRPQDTGPETAEDRWRRMLGEALPGGDLEGLGERGRKPRVQMLRELLGGRRGTEGDRGQGNGAAWGGGKDHPYERQDDEPGPRG